MLKGKPVPKMEQGRSVDLVGADFNVARGYVADAKMVKEEAPELFEEIKAVTFF